MRLAYTACKKHLFDCINKLYEKDVPFYVRITTDRDLCCICRSNCYYVVREILTNPRYSSYQNELKSAIDRPNLLGIFNTKEE